MKILLLGSSGLLGAEVKKLLPLADAPSSVDLDITDKEKVASFLKRGNYDLIFHTAAYTQVDEAETQRKKCWDINVKGLENLLEGGVPIIHISTDYVFSAPQGIFIPEDYPPRPLNYYGYTKHEAEKRLESSGTAFYNIRTSWLFGPQKDNFISRILDLSRSQKTLSVVNDQIGRPTYTPDLAHFLVENFVYRSPRPGHYHFQNQGPAVSWYDLAKFVLQQDGWEGELLPISSEKRAQKAQRPLNSLLENTKIKDPLPQWEEGVKKYYKTKKTPVF